VDKCIWVKSGFVMHDGRESTLKGFYLRTAACSAGAGGRGEP
jgi:hypothetical protein